MVPPMADEFYEKYKHLSHQELYRMLRGGSVRQVDGVGDTWASITSTLNGLADTLRQDMDRLLTGLDGSTTREVTEGISALARRAKTLAEEATGMRAGLTAMAQALAVAQRQAEAPQEVPAVTTQAVSSVLGAEVGHVPTPEELARARERMIWLVARLAAQYGLAEHTNWPAVAQLSTAIVGGAQLVHHGHGHDDGRHGRRGTRLLGVTDLVRHQVQPSHLSSPLSGHNPLSAHGLVQTSAEASGVLRGTSGGGRAPSVHVVSASSAMPLPAAADGPAPTAGAGAAAAAAPPPMGLGGASMASSGPVIGGSASPGMGPGGGLDGGHGLAAEVTWQSADNVEWMDPEEAAPPVIGA
jgi:hypothetical protein